METSASNKWTGLPEESDALERAATEWFFRRDRGFTPEEEQEFSEWLRADSRNEEIFLEIEAVWDDLPAVRNKVNLNYDRPVPVALVPPITAAPIWRRKLVWMPAALAAAAAIAVAYIGWWRPAHYENMAITEVGGLRHMQLPDGSIVTLNTDTVVAVSYSPEERRVQLSRGEAHFTVTKNKARPFIVSAGGVDVRAVGTAFNVRLRGDDVDVLVTEGKVHASWSPSEAAAIVAADSPLRAPVPIELFLEVGDRATIRPIITAIATVEPPAVEKLAAPVIEQAMAWQYRRLEFEDVTLGDMVAEFNRYNSHKLTISDPKLAAQRFGGSFPSDDYESFIRVLESTFNVSADRRGDVTRLKVAP